MTLKVSYHKINNIYLLRRHWCTDGSATMKLWYQRDTNDRNTKSFPMYSKEQLNCISQIEIQSRPTDINLKKNVIVNVFEGRLF